MQAARSKARVHVLQVVGIAAGLAHTVACTDSGAVFAWGWNSDGQLGLGDDRNRSQPELVAAAMLEDVDVNKVCLGCVKAGLQMMYCRVHQHSGVVLTIWHVNDLLSCQGSSMLACVSHAQLYLNTCCSRHTSRTSANFWVTCFVPKPVLAVHYIASKDRLHLDNPVVSA